MAEELLREDDPGDTDLARATQVNFARDTETDSRGLSDGTAVDAGKDAQ